MSTIYVNVIDGEVHEVVTDNPKDEVYIVDFDKDDSQELSEAYSEILSRLVTNTRELKELR